MNRIRSLRLATALIIIIICLPNAMSQRRWEPYFNAGYITNFQKAPENPEADKGASIRIGILNKGLFGKGRLGFYGAYTWFNEYHPPVVEYDDSGKLLTAGINYRLLRVNDMRLYANLGIGNEWYYSTYPDNSREVDISIKPDFGILLCYKWLNLYTGWQPSDPSHLVIGIGLNLFSESEKSEDLY
jgi:hypothetical protein